MEQCSLKEIPEVKEKADEKLAGFLCGWRDLNPHDVATARF